MVDGVTEDRIEISGAISQGRGRNPREYVLYPLAAVETPIHPRQKLDLQEDGAKETQVSIQEPTT